MKLYKNDINKNCDKKTDDEIKSTKDKPCIVGDIDELIFPDENDYYISER